MFIWVAFEYHICLFLDWEFDELCYSPIINRGFELKTRQLILLNNKRFLHARTEIKDKNRHLIRARFFTNFDKFTQT